MTPERPLGAPLPPDRTSRVVATAFRAWATTLAVFLLAAALAVWLRLLDGGGTQLDAATRGWHVALLGAFAVLLPLAALGTWLVQSWGVVLWLLAVALHALSVWLGWADDGANGPVMAFNALALALFAPLQIARVWDATRVARRRKG